MKKVKISFELLKVIISTLLFGISFLVKDNLQNILLLISYVVISYELYIEAVKGLMEKEFFDENLLMILATIGAIIINKYEEAVTVILLFQIGEYLSHRAVNDSKRKITSLLDLRCDYINLKEGDKLKRVDIKKVNIGDLFVVKPGEKVGLDGVVVDGKSSMDTASLTGEVSPLVVDLGSEVLSGFVNKDSLVTIKATSVYETSTATKIINMIENSNSVKTKTEKFITKFSKIYTPIVVLMAFLIVVIPVIFGGDFDTYLYRSLVFLVTSCPCALVISIPLGYFCGIGRLSLEGILAKGSCEIDKFANINAIAFDKTGTITEGVFEVEDICSDCLSKDELLCVAAHAEYYSLHPIAKSIVRKYKLEVLESAISDFQEIIGKGIKVLYNKERFIVGNKSLMDDEKIKCDLVNTCGSVVYVAKDKKCIGYLVVADHIKKEAFLVIKDLNELGINKVVMISGDKLANVEAVCEKVSIREYFGELLPNEKVEKMKLLKKDGLVAFVGDGINDAPVLKISDLGISMGGVGSDAAIEASDIVLMYDDLTKIKDGIIISRMTKNIIKFNIVFAILAKVIILLLGMFGYTTIWLAVFADVGVTLLAVLNTLRIMIIKVK